MPSSRTPVNKVDKEAPWIVEVLYPLELNVDECMDLRIDRIVGNHNDIRQCWGSDNSDTGIRCLRYSFYKLQQAMAAAKSIADLPARFICRVDVYDAKYPEG